MPDPSASPLASGRHFELLSRQRQKAQRRLFRERSRNARFAVAGVVSLAVLLGLGIRSGWMLTPAPALPDEKTREFAATRVGHIMLPAGEDATCRVLDFHNDSGAFSEGRAVSCVDAPVVTIDPLATDANGRASSIRGFFSRR